MQNGIIDLRSDTVTHPTAAMRQAMAAAPVGDDVYGDDPTVNRLERLAAEVTGKQAALFVTSGTMGNQIALAVWAARGEEVILPDNCHIVAHEAGAAAWLAGAQLRTLPATRGVPMQPADVARTIRTDTTDIHVPRTALITYENADSDGYVRSLSWMDEIRVLADRHHLPIHLDGARLFNAAAVLALPAASICARADSVTFCLSKGLCAPVGSLLCGPRDFIAQARRVRKKLGGGMRQAGILAAAGLLAIREMVPRLDADHARARRLAAALAAIPGLALVDKEPTINMVWLRLDGYPLDARTLANRLREEGILINQADAGLLRLVTHQGVDDADIARVVEQIAMWAVP